jgi:HSP20 family protein
MADLVRWEPFRDLVTLRDAMDRLFEESFVQPVRLAAWDGGRGAPVALDIFQTDDEVIVKASLPGIKADEIDISLTGDVLTIKGESKAEEEVKEEHYIRREMRYGSFIRTVQIPVSVNTEQAEAAFENGVLTLKLPKAEEVKPKAIKVQAKGK